MSPDNQPPSHFPGGSRFLPDGRIQCKHGQVIHRKCVRRDGDNKGKLFYSCFKSKDDPHNCKFFMWNEEVEAIATNTAAPRSSPRWVPSSELPEDNPVVSRKRQRAQTPSTPTSSPECPTSHFNDQEVDIGSSKHASYSPLKRARTEDNELTALGSAKKLTGKNMPLRDVEENPFLPSNPISAPLAVASPDNSPSKVPPEEHELNDALHTFTTFIEDYKKVKRQKVAAEKARDAKAERMAQLEKQNAQLKELNESLQKQIEIYRGMLG